MSLDHDTYGHLMPLQFRISSLDPCFDHDPALIEGWLQQDFAIRNLENRFNSVAFWRPFFQDQARGVCRRLATGEDSEVCQSLSRFGSWIKMAGGLEGGLGHRGFSKFAKNP